MTCNSRLQSDPDDFEDFVLTEVQKVQSLPSCWEPADLLSYQPAYSQQHSEDQVLDDMEFIVQAQGVAEWIETLSDKGLSSYINRQDSLTQTSWCTYVMRLAVRVVEQLSTYVLYSVSPALLAFIDISDTR